MKNYGSDGVPYDEWLAEMRARGEETRHFDPAYVCLRRSRPGFEEDPAVFVKKATLGHIQRIEALRWKAHQNLQRLMTRWSALYKAVSKVDGECFVPNDAPGRFRVKNARRAELSRRIAVEQSPYEGMSSHYDDDFWKHAPTKHSGTEMEVIAAAVELGEWEQVTLPARIARSKDPVKLDLGRRWRHVECRESALRTKCGLMNEMLLLAVRTTALLPQTRPFYDVPVVVEINGRRYPFAVRGDYAAVKFEEWPQPNDIPNLIVGAAFALDETLIGKPSDAVRARLGEPLLIEDGCVWRYKTGTVTFTKDRSFDKVKSVDQTPNDIQAPPPCPPLAKRKKSPRAQKKAKRGVACRQI